MKLTADKNEELEKLSLYFEKIESIASRMGVEIEDLMQEFKNNNTAAYGTIKKSILDIAKKRQHFYKDGSDQQSPAAGMNLTLTEDNES